MNFRRNNLPVVLTFGFLCAAISACGPGSKVAAVVNGQVITVKELDDRMAKMNPATRQALGDSRSRVLEQMIMESLLIHEARRRGLEGDAEVKNLLKEARRQILFGRLVEVLRSEQSAQVADETIAAYYEKNRSEFMQPETLRANHILTENEEAAKSALARIKAGEPFATVAQEVSVDPSKANGGDIGLFTKGQVIPEFEGACQRLKPGELSDVVKSSLGYHVIQLTEKNPARERTLDEVKDRIRRAMEQEQRQKHLEEVVHELRSKAQVRVRDSSLLPAGSPESEPAAGASENPAEVTEEPSSTPAEGATPSS